jgi:septum site-determining protein MinD
VGELIAVASGKGGTGKTSVTAGVATALAQSGKRVLCIDCDVGLRNLDISLGLTESCPLSFLDVCEGGYPMSQVTVHPVYPTLHFLTAPMNCPPERIDPEKFGAFLMDVRIRYDFVFLDAPAGVDAGFKLAATFADRCILVTGPGPAAVRDAARTAQVLELMGKTNIRLIVNRVNPKLVRAMDTTIDDVMDTAGLPLMGIVPEDKNVTLAAAFNQPLLKYKPRTAAAKACGRIAKRILGLPVPISIR